MANLLSQFLIGGGRPDIDALGEAISLGESGSRGGDYMARGPRTRTGARAYGRYQVLETNIGPWTERWYGRRLTPEEFRRNREAQDAVFQGQFGEYVNRYGPERAARAWYGGPRAVDNPTWRDLTNPRAPTVGEYGRRFTAAYRPGQTPPPTVTPPTPETGSPDQFLGIGNPTNAPPPTTEPPPITPPPNPTRDVPPFSEGVVRREPPPTNTAPNYIGNALAEAIPESATVPRVLDQRGLLAGMPPQPQPPVGWLAGFNPLERRQPQPRPRFTGLFG